VPKCELGVGCVQTPMSCDDENPCTIDSCVGGQCFHSPNTALCDDGLRCTDDICSPNAQGGFDCENRFDSSNCGILSPCQTALCGLGANDCKVVGDNTKCPPFPIPGVTCLVPQCKADGSCGFLDTCTPADCGGCAQCSCNAQAKACVPSCPS
jgi:hypothetical protein